MHAVAVELNFVQPFRSVRLIEARRLFSSSIVPDECSRRSPEFHEWLKDRKACSQSSRPLFVVEHFVERSVPLIDARCVDRFDFFRRNRAAVRVSIAAVVFVSAISLSPLTSRL